MGEVKIYCDCGLEIWTELSHEAKIRLTLHEVEKTAICADCHLTSLNLSFLEEHEDNANQKEFQGQTKETQGRSSH